MFSNLLSNVFSAEHYTAKNPCFVSTQLSFVPFVNRFEKPYSSGYFNSRRKLNTFIII